jgi:hypothetical protein
VQELMLATLGKKEGKCKFPKFFLMRNWEHLILWHGSSNVSSTGYGEHSHKEVKAFKLFTNNRPGQTTKQVSTSALEVGAFFDKLSFDHHNVCATIISVIGQHEVLVLEYFPVLDLTF